MKVALRWRAPTKTIAAAGEEVSDPGSPIGTAPGLAVANVSVKLASAALLGCLAAGPLALVVAGTRWWSAVTRSRRASASAGRSG